MRKLRESLIRELPFYGFVYDHDKEEFFENEEDLYYSNCTCRAIDALDFCGACIYLDVGNFSFH